MNLYVIKPIVEPSTSDTQQRADTYAQYIAAKEHDDQR